jgi:DNA-binding response OmpR family regulator
MANPKTSKRILLVDDNETHRMGLRDRLEATGYEVHSADGGEEALQLAQNMKFHLITLDLLMPQPDGFEVFRRLKQLSVASRTPILVLTVVGLGPRVQEVVEEGAHYLQKRDALSQLVTKVKGLIGEPQPESTVDGKTNSASIVRARRAAEMLVVVDKIERELGQVSCATLISRLKQALGRCHVELDNGPSEANFLSIVTLIEASLVRMTWKEYTREHVEVLRKALTVASKESPITYDDCQQVREYFREVGIETSPRLDLGTLNEVGQDFEKRPAIDMREMICALRDFWGEIKGVDRRIQEPLAVLHGIAERMAGQTEIDQTIGNFLQEQFTLVKNGVANALSIENKARAYGLPVCDPQEKVMAIVVYFGRVGKIEEQYVRVILVDDEDSHILEDRKVPCNWLPIAYRSEGAGVAWVERRYASGFKGRFEPASVGEDDEHT